MAVRSPGAACVFPARAPVSLPAASDFRRQVPGREAGDRPHISVLPSVPPIQARSTARRGLCAAAGGRAGIGDAQAERMPDRTRRTSTQAAGVEG